MGAAAGEPPDKNPVHQLMQQDYSESGRQHREIFTLLDEGLPGWSRAFFASVIRSRKSSSLTTACSSFRLVSCKTVIC
jgi:hypothetical protein